MSDTPPPVPHGDTGATVPVGGAAWGATPPMADEPTVAEPRPAPAPAAAPSAWHQPPAAAPAQSAWHQPPAAAPAQSAWTQAATTYPPTPPAGQGFPSPPTARPPRRTERMWLLGSGIVVVVALIVTIVLVTTGGSGGSGGGVLAGATGGLGSGAPTTTKPAGPVFTHVPASCTLISASTISAYAPGTTCTPAPTDAHDLPGLITRQPSWQTPMGSDTSDELEVQVHLVVGALSATMYPQMKQSTIGVMGNFDTITDQHAVTGVGSQAVYAYGTGKNGINSGDAEIVILDGNAELDISYSGTLENSADMNGQPVSDSDAEAAEIALAKDVLSHLS